MNAKNEEIENTVYKNTNLVQLNKHQHQKFNE